MGFKDRYTTDKMDTTKLYVSPESFAVCELIDELTKAIHALRSAIG